MSNSEQPIAIVKHTATVSITFVEKPSLEQRQRLKDAGYRYESGNWFRSHVEGQHATGETIDQILAA